MTPGRDIGGHVIRRFELLGFLVSVAATSCRSGDAVDVTPAAPPTSAAPVAPPAAGPPAAAARVNSGAEWIEWYRALGPVELHRRAEHFLDSQRPPPPEYLDAIAKALRDADRDVRALAAFALASRFNESAPHADRLREALRDGDPFVRFAAAVALESVTGSGAESVAPFAELLHAPDAVDRARAASWLAGADETGATSIPALERALAEESDLAARREEAAQLCALAKGLPDAARALRGRLDDVDPCVRASALAAQLVGAGFDDELARRGVVGLAESDAEARSILASAINNQPHEIPEPVRRALRACQLDPDRRVRHAALLALSSTRRDRKHAEWEATVVAASDPDPLVRQYALFMISILHDTAGVSPPSVLPVVARLTEDPDATPDPRWRSTDPDAPPVSGPAFTYGAMIRGDAMALLLDYGEEARPYARWVARALEDDRDGVHQTRAALFLAAMGPDARPFLEALRTRERRTRLGYPAGDDPDDSIARAAAAWAVDVIEGKSAESPELRVLLANLVIDPLRGGNEEGYWTRWCEPMRPALLATAGADDAVLRTAALYVLAQLYGAADPDVGARLAAGAHDADVRVRRVAAGVASRVNAAAETGFTHEVVVTLADDPDEQVRAALAPAEGER